MQTANTREPATRSRATLFTGVFTGALLIIVMFAALVAANRMPSLERYAFERNAASYAIFALVMLIPVARFLNRPVQLFASAMLAWVLFAGAYDVAGLVFRSLFDVLRTPFEALIEGTIVYGTIAVAAWVLRMALHARRHPLISAGKRAVRQAARQTIVHRSL